VANQRRATNTNKNSQKNHNHDHNHTSRNVSSNNHHTSSNPNNVLNNNRYNENQERERNECQIQSQQEQQQVQHQQRSNQLVTRFDLGSEAEDSFDVDPSINQSVKTSSKAPSITHDSINTRTDNVSTLPVISMSTMSVRSSTFSEHSEPSTSGTIFSDHPTVYTNASTVGIPPASILDRRERLHNPISLNNYHLTGNNNSSHTVNTATTPNSNMPNEYNGDISSMKS